MTKPMYCPMSLANKVSATAYTNAPTKWSPMECTPNCAWAVTDGRIYWCGMLPQLNVKPMVKVNVRPLKDDSE